MAIWHLCSPPCLYILLKTLEAAKTLGAECLIAAADGLAKEVGGPLGQAATIHGKCHIDPLIDNGILKYFSFFTCF